MDSFKGSYDRRMKRAASAAADDVLGVRKGDRVLIVANPESEIRAIAMAVFDACNDADAAASMIFQRTKGQFDFAEEEVIQAIAANPDIVISVSSDRLGKDRFGMKHFYEGKRKYDHIFDKLYEEGLIRGFWSPGATVDMFSRTVPIDYSLLRSDCRKVSRILEGAERARVTAPGGTDITIGLNGRKPKPDDGDFRKPGRAGNLPSGEVYVSPALGTANGMISFDGSIVVNEGEIVIRKPVLATVRNGYIVSIDGGREAERLEDSISEGERRARKMGKSGDMKPAIAEKYAKNARSVGELGIGLNRKAKIVANMLEDEKVYGTCHFAVGSNYDGDADALIHLDGLVKRPTIDVEMKSGATRGIMTDGKLVWE